MQMKMVFQKGHFEAVLVELGHLFLVRQSARRQPIPQNLIWALSLNFLPQ
jgi:hypothetical protein